MFLSITRIITCVFIYLCRFSVFFSFDFLSSRNSSMHVQRAVHCHHHHCSAVTTAAESRLCWASDGLSAALFRFSPLFITIFVVERNKFVRFCVWFFFRTRHHATEAADRSHIHTVPRAPKAAQSSARSSVHRPNERNASEQERTKVKRTNKKRENRTTNPNKILLLPAQPEIMYTFSLE